MISILDLKLIAPHSRVIFQNYVTQSMERLMINVKLQYFDNKNVKFVFL